MQSVHKTLQDTRSMMQDTATTKPTKKHEEVRKSQPRKDTKKIKYCSMQEVNEDIKVVMMMQSLKIAS